MGRHTVKVRTIPSVTTLALLHISTFILQLRVTLKFIKLLVLCEIHSFPKDQRNIKEQMKLSVANHAG